jgi:hypothetical protein
VDGPLEPAIDVAILADAVQAAAGKLYVLGGGWDTLLVPRFPARHSIGIGVKVRVPWTLTDRDFTLAVELQDEDGRPVPNAARLSHGLRAGRPTHHPEGIDVSLVRALTFANVPLPAQGGYVFSILLGDIERARLSFRVIARPKRA